MDSPNDMGAGGMPDGMPPMPDSPTGPPQNGPMDEPMGAPMDGQGMPDENFDADFDAGVEADEKTDPKRYIQQLAGKLSQSLRKYNSELPRPDADLCKYVVGMTAAQAVEGLSQDDVNEILDKITGDEDGAPAPDGQDDGGAGNMPDPDGNGEGDQMPPPPDGGFNGKESVGSHWGKIRERSIDVTNRPKKAAAAKRNDNKGYRNQPFKSPF